MKYTVLIIDDEKNIRSGLGDALEMDGYTILLAENGAQGLDCFKKETVDVVITDLRMDGLSGQEVLLKISAESPGVPVIVLTGHGSIETAVTAMRNGAYDFMTKPVNLDHLSLLVKRALKTREQSLQFRQLQEELHSKQCFESIIGESPQIRSIFEVIRRVAPTKASVLITGESGVGKELIANAIHNLSTRRDKPFIKVHCAALAESLLESELFGHEKGAFTGALSRKRGRFELSSSGSIFLDEIGEIDQNVQIKILRVLQDHCFERVGGEETIEVDTRLISATNKDLETEIKQGTFREDLFYRLNVVRIHVPPLRERKDDIPFLVTAFLDEFAHENDKHIDSIDSKARSVLYSYNWPGNIRQLRNCIESSVVMCGGNSITLDDLPPSIRTSSDSNDIRIPMGTSLPDAEKILIRETLSAQNGNKTKTAELLGIGRKTLHRKIEEYSLE